jgi:capsular exopolysaccharide synthesis family protein
LAESIANAHANEFITLIQNNLARLATVNLEFLRERLVTAETAYTDAERAALKYAKDNDLAGSNVKAIQNALAQRYNHLFGRLHELILNRAKSEARFREYRSSSSNAVVFDPEVGTEFSRLSELDAKLKVAKEAGIDNLYFFEQLKSERSTLLSALKEFGKRRMKSSEMEFKAAKEAESLLRNELEKTQDEERRLYSKMVDFSAFRDSADAARENFKQVRKRFEDAQLNAQNEQNIVLLIDKARTPQSPTSPNVNLIIGLGVICSFLGSIFLTIAVDSVDQTIGSVLDLTKTLNTPVLGMIPRFSDSSLYGYGYEYEGYGVDVSRVSKFTGSFKSVTGVFKTSTDRPSPKKKVRQKGQPMVETAPVLSPEATEAVDEVDSLIKELSEDTNSGTKLHGRLEEVTENFVRPDSEGLSDSQVVDCNTLPGHGFEIYEHVVAHGKQWTRVSEAFREVFVAIESYSKQAMNSILIASGDKGDGKSTIAANLAVVYAQSGRRTVLIDADIRLPSVQESIGIPEGAIGLTDFLAQDVGAMEIVYPTENESLFVIPAGTLAGPSPQLGTGKKLKELLELLSDDFDTIIIDGPPVLHVADGLTISRMVDGVALVVRNGKTLKETAKWVTNRLQYLEANVLGVIYNDVPKMHNFSRYSY